MENWQFRVMSFRGYVYFVCCHHSGTNCRYSVASRGKKEQAASSRKRHIWIAAIKWPVPLPSRWLMEATLCDLTSRGGEKITLSLCRRNLFRRPFCSPLLCRRGTAFFDYPCRSSNQLSETSDTLILLFFAYYKPNWYKDLQISGNIFNVWKSHLPAILKSNAVCFDRYILVLWQ